MAPSIALEKTHFSLGCSQAQVPGEWKQVFVPLGFSPPTKRRVAYRASPKLPRPTFFSDLIVPLSETMWTSTVIM